MNDYLLESKLNNREEHIRQVLLHLAVNRNKQVVVFIDNADQRNDETQQQAFLISQEIAENWKPVTVFVSLRPETFYRSLKKGALSGFVISRHISLKLHKSSHLL